VRADAVVAPLLAHLGSVVTSVEEAPYLDLSGDTGFSAWEIRRKPKAQKNRRRQARRLADMGEVTYASHTATPEAGRLASRAIRLKRATLADKGDISPALSDERFEAFFREAASDCDRPAGLTIATISSAGEPIALKILVTSDQAYFLHVAVFDAGFEKCAPGALLLEHTIGETIRTGRRTLDLLPPRHGYKMDFADGIILVQCHGLALTAAGWLYTQGYLRLRRHLKGAVEALPAPIRRALMKLAG
jgi:CelD/BcsL family acetyltransferase involved in cellulose biosynthesis